MKGNLKALIGVGIVAGISLGGFQIAEDKYKSTVEDGLQEFKTELSNLNLDFSYEKIDVSLLDDNLIIHGLKLSEVKKEMGSILNVESVRLNRETLNRDELDMSPMVDFSINGATYTDDTLKTVIPEIKFDTDYFYKYNAENQDFEFKTSVKSSEYADITIDLKLKDFKEIWSYAALKKKTGENFNIKNKKQAELVFGETKLDFLKVSISDHGLNDKLLEIATMLGLGSNPSAVRQHVSSQILGNKDVPLNDLNSLSDFVLKDGTLVLNAKPIEPLNLFKYSKELNISKSEKEVAEKVQKDLGLSLMHVN